jgi:uncharacterized SAM-binding protein YcdF (DUF218 family)
MTGLLIGAGIFIVLIIGLGIAALIIIVFFLVVHYGGRSAQTMNPPPADTMHRQDDGTIVWEGTYPAGYYNPRTGVYSKEPPADYVGEYNSEADRKYLYGQ